MIITGEVLDRFGACRDAQDKFVKENPQGFDISGLWGTDDEAALVWAVLFATGWGEHIGWAIGVGLLPARIRIQDMRGADLRGANLWGANLRGANLWRANLRGADLRGARNVEYAIGLRAAEQEGDTDE